MSTDILANVFRDKVLLPLDMPIPMELHFVGEMEMHGPGGPVPHYRYLGIVWRIFDLRQNDYLQDTLTTDPVTQTLAAYQIVSKPEPFPDGHMEFRADDARITGF